MKKSFIVLFLLFILTQCTSKQIIPEPSLEQVTFKSSTVCPVVSWWWPFCSDGKANSLQIRAIYNNQTGDKKYILDYYLDSFDTDLPVGVSLGIDGTYYNLKKIATDYAEILKLSSELSPEVMTKLNSSSSKILMSYSNRKNTLNFTLSESSSNSLRNNLKDVTKSVNAQDKLRIVK